MFTLALSIGISLSTFAAPFASAQFSGETRTRCDVVYADGKPIQFISDGTVSVSIGAPVLEEKRSFSSTIGVSNKSAQSIDVNPATFQAHIGDEKTSANIYAADMDPVLKKEQRSAQSREAVAAALGSFGSSLQTNTATVHNTDGTSSTVTYHDPSADASARASSSQSTAQLDSYYSYAYATLLRRNTLQPGSDVYGHVYFIKPKRLNKKSSLTEVTITIDNRQFVSRWNQGNPDASCK